MRHESSVAEAEHSEHDDLKNLITEAYKKLEYEGDDFEVPEMTNVEALKGKKLIYIDDTKDLFRLYGKYLIAATGKEVGFILYEGQNFADLAKEIASQSPDVVLIDAELVNNIANARANGADLVPFIKAENPDIMCIGFSSSQVEDEFRRQGAGYALKLKFRARQPEIVQGIAKEVENLEHLHHNAPAKAA